MTANDLCPCGPGRSSTRDVAAAPRQTDFVCQPALHCWLALHQVEIRGLPPVAAYQTSKARIARRIQKSVLFDLFAAAPLVEVTANARPHFQQNRESSGKSVPQFEQNTPDLHQRMSSTTQDTAVLRAGKFMSGGKGYSRHLESEPHSH